MLKTENTIVDIKYQQTGTATAVNPLGMREAHAKLDDIVESCYPGYPFSSDEARLECLFKLYEKMTAKKMKSF